MNLFICEICGDAYIGAECPSDCPFCGARAVFIKPASEAKPIVNEKTEISADSRKNLEETLALELRATAIYQCIAGKSEEYRIVKMYKRLAKIELEHAIVVTKLLALPMPAIQAEDCSSDEIENFKRTIALEDHAVALYRGFAAGSPEMRLKKFFGALVQAEQGHVELIKMFLR